jgi:hypothetical protein
MKTKIVRFEVFTAVTMMIVVFWVVPPWGFFRAPRRNNPEDTILQNKDCLQPLRLY